MEVIRNADIARLVLGYLRDENLKKVANLFCKTSPYLQDEYHLQKKGYRLVSLGSGQLMDIIKEYCDIKSKVEQFTETFPQGVGNTFIKHNTLSKKISLLLEAAKKGVVREENDSETSKLKRRRSFDSVDCSNLEATRIQDLPGYSPILSKRRRLSGSYLFLNSESDAAISPTDHSESPSRSKSPMSSSDSPSEIARVPSIPVISETLLENSQFHNKLAENINRALQNSAKKQTPVKPGTSDDTTNDSLNRELDEMIKNILDVTEKDPTFDEIIEDVVYTRAINNSKNLLTNNKSTQVSPKAGDENSNIEKPKESEAGQSKIENPDGSETRQTEAKQTMNSASLETSTPKIFISTIPSQSTTTSQQTEVVTTSSPKISTESLANNSLNISLLDPSLSISKFIVFNPNESLEGQLTGEQIISTSNLSNIQGFGTFGEEVMIDMETGQMSIPISMANNTFDFPAIINSNNMQEISRGNFTLHTPVVEEIYIPADQLPVSTETIVLSEIENNSSVVNQTKNIPNKPIILPTSLDSRVALEKATPSTSTINPQIVRSLSTPRRRTSHVRVLKFSSPQKAPVENFNAAKNGKMFKPESATITDVSFIGIRNRVTTATTSNLDLNYIPSKEALNMKPLEPTVPVATESSNSNSLDFAVDKSNETVIIRNISETPKRKTDSKSCVRNLSRSNSLEDHSKNDTTLTKTGKNKNNSSKTVRKFRNKSILKNIKEHEEEASTEENLDPLQQWQKMRTTVNSKNFDHHIRKIVSKTHIPEPRPPNKRRRRRIGNKLDLQQSRSEPNEAKTPENELEQSSNLNKIESIENKGTKKKASPTRIKSVPKKTTPVKSLIKIKISSSKKRKDGQTVKAAGEESKSKKIDKKCDKQIDNEVSAKDVLTESGKEKKIAISEQRVSKDTDCRSEGDVKELPIKAKGEVEQSSTQENKSKQSEVVHREIQRRTANIAHLLETPYKDLDDPSSCPITPRFLIPESHDTPITKMMNSIREVSAAKNFDVPTPSFAITPGSSLTPKEKETPRSGYRSSYATDYSSGGSYYKPDESEDLDKNLDRLLAAERESRKATAEKTQTEVSQNASNAECIKEVVLETKIIPVPAVLERVKSFSDEAPDVMPHYTFAEGLPESTHESASSDSSNSSTSSSSSSSSNSTTSNSTGISLSDIESSEDEDWKQQPIEITSEQLNENSLITEDGEVRYPFRNWITPKKLDSNSPLKSQPKPGTSSECNPREIKSTDENQTKRLSDLEEKRLRMKEKLKEDLFQTDNKLTVKIIKRQKTIGTKKINKGPEKITPDRQNPRSFKKISPPSRENSKDVPYKADNQVDMLKALNLSKRIGIKSSIKEQTSIVTRFIESNDNAVMDNDFTCQEEDFKDREEVDQIRNAALALTTMQRKKTKLTNAMPIKGSNPPKKGRSRRSQDLKVFPKRSSMLLRARNQKIKNIGASIPRNVKPTEKENTPQKIITNQTPPELIKQPRILLKNLTPIEISNAPQYTKKELRCSKQPAGKFSTQPIQISEIRSSVDEPTEPSAELQPIKDKNPLVTSNTEEKKQKPEHNEDEEDEDPYDLCKLDAINENDGERYRKFVYEGPDNDVPNPTHNSTDNILASVMNIFLDGIPHVLKVTEEIELFQNIPGPEKQKLIKNVPKKRNRKEHIEPSSKKCTKTSTSKRIPESPDKVSHNFEESRDDHYPQHTSTPLQPNFRIIYQHRGPKTKGKSGIRDCAKSNRTESFRSGTMPTIDENWVSSSTSAQAPITNHPEHHAHSIKAEDINAVLSHLHGDDEI